ncbi:hypothetical protein KY334_01895 [Candidatus Woesearchaeota archaeon]|nr:hypothetical protein [Candidatus Woesearchaeota archaeon]
MSDYNNAMDHDLIDPRQTGFTTIISTDQLQELKAKIKMGVSKVELGFVGRGKTMGNTISPETYGEDERQDLRELAKLNDIELTTHTAPDAGPLSGLGQGGFDEATRKQVVDEVKRAIDFAADVAEGGAVVAHTGEFERPLYESEIADREEGKRKTFLKHGTNEEEDNESRVGVKFLVDERTGEVIRETAIRKDQKFYMPEVDIHGNIIEGEKEVKERDWNWVVAKTKEHNDWVKQEREKAIREGKQINEKDYQELKPENWMFQQKINQNISSLNGNIAHYSELASDYEKRGGEHAKEHAKSMRESVLQMKGQIEELKLKQKHAKSIEEVGVEKTARSLAELGMYTRDRQLKRENDTGEKFKRDLFVAPENIAPESYGGHPQELKRLVLEGRKKMANLLHIQKGLSQEEAKKEARNHIRATFDVGHANTWRRYFQGSDEDFKKWVVDQVKDLTKDDIIGHIHLSDNFGYHDEHVVPGQGTAPLTDSIKEIKNMMKKSGKKDDIDFIIEAGRHGNQAWIRGLKEVSSPIYGISRPNYSDPWGIIHKSYFSSTAPPYFVIGQYGDSFGERMKKDFGAWSETSFE